MSENQVELSLIQKVTSVRDLMKDHKRRLKQDIDNSLKNNDEETENYYKGSKDTCEMFLRYLDEIVENNNDKRRTREVKH